MRLALFFLALSLGHCTAAGLKNSQDTSTAVDLPPLEDFVLDPDDLGVSEDLFVPLDGPPAENPCVVGAETILLLGTLDGGHNFQPFVDGAPLPFEFGPQGGSMVVADMLHTGTAGLNVSLVVQVFNADTGASLITYEQIIAGSTSGPEGLEDPMYMCVDELGNVLSDLWLASWDDLPNDQNALLQAYASFDMGPDAPPMVLSFEVTGRLTYTP